MEENNSNIDAERQKAIALFRRNQLHEAKSLCLEICRHHGADARMWHMLGVINGRLGMADSAAEACRNAVALDPLYAPAHSDLGNALFAKGRPDDALDCYREALRLDGGSAQALNNLGTVLNALNRLDEAEEAYRSALRLQPNAVSYSNLGNVLLRRHKSGEATEMYRKCLEHDPGGPPARQDPRTTAVMRNARMFLAGGDYVFVLSHMRSFSSLLSHILGSNDEIGGYSEMHRPYRDPLDLLQLRISVHEAVPDHSPKRYTLDKVLHNKYPISDPVLLQDSLRLVFLVRRPAETIKSIMYMGREPFGIDWCRDPEKATQYYVNRLGSLADTSGRTRTPGLFIRSEDVTDRTQHVLVSLTHFLSLRQPLREEYMIFENTGKPIFGDPSANIRAGTILRQDGGTKYRDLAVPEDCLARARSAYELCCEALARNCIPCGNDIRQQSPEALPPTAK